MIKNIQTELKDAGVLLSENEAKLTTLKIEEKKLMEEVSHIDKVITELQSHTDR